MNIGSKNGSLTDPVFEREKTETAIIDIFLPLHLFSQTIFIQVQIEHLSFSLHEQRQTIFRKEIISSVFGRL
jgi:hypothetical protein